MKYLYAQTHANHNRSCAFDWLVNIACLPKYILIKKTEIKQFFVELRIRMKILILIVSIITLISLALTALGVYPVEQIQLFILLLDFLSSLI